MSSALIAAIGSVCSWRNYLSEGTLTLDETQAAEECVLWQIIQVFNKTELISQHYKEQMCPTVTGACIVIGLPA